MEHPWAIASESNDLRVSVSDLLNDFVFSFRGVFRIQSNIKNGSSGENS